MPAIVSTCRVCALQADFFPLWVEIHDRILFREEPKIRVHAWAEEEAAKVGVKLSKLEYFSRHFAEHVPDVRIFRREIKKEIGLRRERLETSDEDRSQFDLWGSIFGLEWDVVDQMLAQQRLLKDAETRLQVYSDYLKKSEKMPGFVPNRDDIHAYQKMISLHLADAERLNKLRNTNAVAGQAVDSAVDLVVRAFMQTAKAVADEAAVRVRQVAEPESRVPQEVAQLILVQLGETLKSMSDDAKTLSKKEFGIDG